MGVVAVSSFRNLGQNGEGTASACGLVVFFRDCADVVVLGSSRFDFGRASLMSVISLTST